MDYEVIFACITQKEQKSGVNRVKECMQESDSIACRTLMVP